MSFLDKSAQWSIVRETTYADATVIPTDGSKAVELINPTMDAATDMIEREVLKNSLVKAQPILGKETASGSMGLELSSVTAGEINGDLLYHSGFGNKIAAKASVSESGTALSNTATVIGVTAASAGTYTVGQGLKVTTSAGAEFVVVRAINTVADTLTISPALVGTPTSVTTVEGLLSYTIARPSTPAVSLAIQEYFEGTNTAAVANQFTYTYRGCVVTDVTLNFPVANIVKADFSVAGANFEVASNVGVRNPICYDFSPYVAKNMSFLYGGVSYDVSDLTVNIASDVYDVEALTTDGITNKVITGKNQVGGSFMLEYNGTALFDAFKAGTDGELFGTVSNATTTMGMYAPKVVITNSSKSIDSSLYKDSADFTCLSSDTCSAETEDAITVFFA